MFKNPYSKPYDTNGQFSGYHGNASYFDISQDRIAVILKVIQERSVNSVLDIGYFPGLIGRLIKDEFPDISLDGIGKANASASTDYPWYDAITDADFDPFYGHLQIPQLNKRYDLIIGIEIIEHLIDPRPFLQFITDHLQPNGIALITTPNVSNFGAIGRLLKGKSNYETLESSIIFVKSDWRAHARLFDRRELTVLGQHAGLAVHKHRYYLNKALFYEQKKGLIWLLRLLFSIIPLYREDQYVVYKIGGVNTGQASAGINRHKGADARAVR